jgi:hypothetical protein
VSAERGFFFACIYLKKEYAQGEKDIQKKGVCERSSSGLWTSSGALFLLQRSHRGDILIKSNNVLIKFFDELDSNRTELELRSDEESRLSLGRPSPKGRLLIQ